MPGHEFRLKASRQFAAMFALIMSVSFIITLFVSLLWWMKLLVLICLSLYGMHLYKQHVTLKSDLAILAIYPNATDWLLKTKRGLLKAELCGDSVVTSFISILRFRIQAQVITQIILRDSLEAGLYRKLLLEIKWR